MWTESGQSGRKKRVPKWGSDASEVCPASQSEVEDDLAKQPGLEAVEGYPDQCLHLKNEGKLNPKEGSSQLEVTQPISGRGKIRIQNF